MRKSPSLMAKTQSESDRIDQNREPYESPVLQELGSVNELTFATSLDFTVE